MDGVCQSCSEPLPDGARFCPSCGARRIAPAARTERRLITTLFCDLVEFTAMAERSDPEDVDALLRPFYALARGVIEQHGGVVEKFVGDAVVGVFGVPRAHEDDPERAVRAAVRLQLRLGELPHHQGEPVLARIGVNTGHALVQLDVDPLAGESFQAGDAVNTAARLLALAPPGGIVVGETTHAMTAHVTEFTALPAVRLRGRQALERPWLVTGTVAQLGVQLQRPEAAPFVGREVELGILTGLFEKSMRSASPQAVLLVGEAGIGKTRLLVELARRLDARPDLLAQWRQVRCSPFEEGAGLWPLAQVVREHAGVVAGDDDASVQTKLERCFAEARDEPWFLQRLRALLGSGGDRASSSENFAAWSRFIELMARVRPTVLVVEDIQWASSTLAEFLQHLRSTIDDVPLLTILTARPELLDGPGDRRTAVAGDPPPPMTLALHPLSERETERLVSLLLHDGDADVSATVVGSCGGNPLYAEEMAGFLADRATGAGPKREMRPDLPPPSLQALIAARLETLDAVERTVLSNAAVVGTTFWRGALHALDSSGAAAVDEALTRLTERELVRPMAGSPATAAEFAFWHTVVRDVTYAMLPRLARASRHKGVADWLEHQEGQWSPAALIAHHLTTALEAARHADAALAAELLEPAVEAHIRAALQTQPVDMRGAERHLDAAAALMPTGHPRRPWVTIERGDALSHIGRLDEARACIEEGVRGAEEAGDRPVAAHGRTRLTRLMNWMGDPDAPEVSSATLEMLRQDGPSATLVTALEEHAMTCVFAFRHSDAITAADAALSMAASLDTPMPARALLWRGTARCGQGDAGGLTDLATALDQAIGQGRSRDLTSLYYNYAGALMTYEGTEQSIAMCQAGVDDMVRRGDANGANALQAGMCFDLLCAGRWDEVLVAGPSLETALERAGDLQMLGEMRSMMALLALLRGDIEPAREKARQAEGTIASVAFGNHAWTCSCFLSAVHHGLSDDEGALAELTTLEQATRGKRGAIATGLPFALRTLTALDASALAERLVDGLSHRPFDIAVLSLWRALAAEHGGRWHEAVDAYRDAVVRWAALAFVTEKAQSQLGLGRCLSRIERSAEAAEPLAAAHAVFAELPMPAAMAEAAGLMTQTGGAA